jgi:hypothetical protein
MADSLHIALAFSNHMRCLTFEHGQIGIGRYLQQRDPSVISRSPGSGIDPPGEGNRRHPKSRQLPDCRLQRETSIQAGKRLRRKQHQLSATEVIERGRARTRPGRPRNIGAEI